MMIKSIQNLLGFRRQIHRELPIPMAIAQQNLSTAFQQDIKLSNQFQVTRHYWGKLDGQTIQLRGPKAVKQIFFITTGTIEATPAGIALHATMYLRPVDFYQTVAAVLFLTGFVAFTMRLSGLVPLFFALSILYGMIQWHFSFYATEITKLLTDFILDQASPTL